MPSYTQDNRALRLTTPLGKDVLLLERISGEEGVSQPFHFRLDLFSESTELDPAALLGKEIGVEIGFGAETRHIRGIVSRFAQAGWGERLVRYRAEMVPKLWLASQARDSRIFQQKSVGDIAAAVLGEMTIAHRLSLAATYDPRYYCAQYRESHLTFLSRLLEQEGIHYYHEHTQAEHKLILADASPQAPECPGAGATLEVRSEGAPPATHPVAVAFEVWREESVVSEKVTLRDHHFQLPTDSLEAAKPVTKGFAGHPVFDYPGGYAVHHDGIDSGGGEQASALQKVFDEKDRIGSVRAREQQNRRAVLHGQSNCPLLLPGHKFALTRHYRTGYNVEYFLLRVRHEASVENYEKAQGAPFTYRATFEAIPIDQAYVPPRATPPARVDGSQTAVVVGPAGAEIFTDKFGRVKVQFHWDREGKKDAGSSCWVRVSTPWAGKQWGMVAVPRVGNEVIVDFLEGDPDQPIITGMVYNADSMPPYALPDNMTQSGIKSRSSQKGTAEHFNEIRFEDKKDAEQLYVHAEKNLDTVVENDETRKVGFEKKDKGDQTVEVFNNQTLKVGAGAGNAADGSQKVEIYKDQVVTVKTGKQEVLVEKGDQTVTVKQGNRSVTLDQGNETVQLKMGNRTVTLDQGNDALTIKTGNLTTKLQMGNASMELDMGNATTNAKLGKISEEAMQGIEMKVGQSSVKIDQTGVTIKGMMVKIEGQVQTQVKGLMTQVNGDAMLMVKGGITMIN